MAADRGGGGVLAGDVTGKSFARRDLGGVRALGARGVRADFRSASLADGLVVGGTYHGSDFSYADLRGTEFRDAVLTTCSFAHARFDAGTRFVRCDLRGARLPAAAREALGRDCALDFATVGGERVGPDPIEAGVPPDALAR